MRRVQIYIKNHINKYLTFRFKKDIYLYNFNVFNFVKKKYALRPHSKKGTTLFLNKNIVCLDR